MHEMPDEYVGREQTWLKHRVLSEYVTQWAHKWGSVTTHRVHLWFVDCFAGPWESRAQAHADTSMAIGLGALNEAAETWASRGNQITVHAVAIATNQSSANAIRELAIDRAGRVDVRVLLGTFAEQVGELDNLLDRDPAFIFVDPTGWKGADLPLIVRLARRQRRDVLINVMYGDLSRFKDDQRPWLRAQMRDFFGLREQDLPPGLSEAELMTFYRQQLRTKSGVRYAADLGVPVPNADRTRFRLVVAGHHPETVKLFRDVEAKVVGKEAAPIRTAAKDRRAEERTGQPLLLSPVPPPVDAGYRNEREASQRDVTARLPDLVRTRGPKPFADLWPDLLCDHHLRLKDLSDIVLDLERRGLVEIRNRRQRERTVKDDHVLAAPPTGPTTR